SSGSSYTASAYRSASWPGMLHLWLVGGGRPAHRPELGLWARPELWQAGLWARAALAAVLGRRAQEPGDGAELDALYDAVEAVGAAPAAGEEIR
ncbi:hypothetical protein I3W98_34445, partial [Streptomyces cavourensis]|nr:hypothetical protein [Streptomyces cavourensis]